MPTHNHHHHHRRNDSGELDVFEAARYYNDNFALTQKVAKEERQGYLRGGRVSLDMPTLRNHHILHQFNHPSSQPYPQKHQEKHQQQEKQQQQQQSKEMKKHKQPSSPGGKLAHFLNSLFNQTSSSKKKKSSSKSSTLSLKDEDESSSGRRKRRSSISHFRSTSSAIDAQSIYSISSSSGFRTPPPYNLNNPQTPKSCKDFHNFSHQKQALDNNAFSSSKPRNVHLIGRGNDNKQEQKGSSLDWFDDKFKLINGSKDFKHTHQEKKKVEEIFKNFKEEEEEGDDGCESDSSSDLFELQIDYGFGFCSSGLPVYETTHMDTIKRSSTTPITNGPIKN